MIAATPNTFVVGAGPVATALAGALRLGGVPVLGLWARRAEAARSAGAVAGVASFSAAPPDLILESDVVLVAVSDDAIAEVAGILVQTGLVTRKHVMLHCSGAMSAAQAFDGAADTLGGVGTMHPLRAIADPRAAMRSIAGTVFGVEGNDTGRMAARTLVEALGGSVLELSGEEMAAYHAAAAMASNYVVALIDAAAELLSRAGVPPDDAPAALIPLARGALDNIAAEGVAAGLTGPIKRGDRRTVERHLAAVDNAPHLADLYRALGQRTVAVARAAGTDPEALRELAELLGTTLDELTSKAS